MENKPDFDSFIASVDGENQGFVRELHKNLTDLGCKTEIKNARNGYVVSYSLDKKTIANYVFRKKGMIARIYGAHVNQYEELLDTLPGEMISGIKDAPVCKRLMNPDSCNPRCSMGYDFRLNGERFKKCRSSAFMFLVCPRNNPYIQSMLLKEAKARRLDQRHADSTE